MFQQVANLDSIQRLTAYSIPCTDQLHCRLGTIAARELGKCAWDLIEPWRG